MGYDMLCNVSTFIDIIENLAPIHLAESWDNVGLQIGDQGWPVKKIWTALDPLPEVVSAACDDHVDLLITHHPLFFKPVNCIDCSTPLGEIVKKALCCQLAVYSAHTNLDSAAGGVNDVLAASIGLSDLRVLAPAMDGNDSHQGLGRVGVLPEPTALGVLAEKIKSDLDIAAVKVVGDLNASVDTVAVCSGSGSSLLSLAFGSGAQVVVSGDLGYHSARDAQQAGIGLIDIGHFGSERLIVEALATSIRQTSKVMGLNIIVEPATIETDPFHHL